MNKKYLLIGLVFIMLLEISGIAFLAEWRSWFWNSVHDKNINDFWYYLAQFTGVVLVLVFVSGYKGWLINLLSLAFRESLTLRTLKNGYSKQEGYRQRIQEDCREYPALSLQLGTDLASSFVQLSVFAYIIIYQSTFYNLGAVTLYTIIGTIIASLIARPLIKLNYNNQVVEASFRQNLTKNKFQEVFDNNYKLFKQLKFLTYFQSFYNQITVIIPLLILSHSYFSGIIEFGVLMQLSACIGAVIEQGSYFINSFKDINKWLSCKKRLVEMRII